MRARSIRTITGVGVVSIALALSACGKGVSTTDLGNVKVGKVGYIDAWDDCARTGDQARVELNRQGVWMVEKGVQFSNTKTGAYKVKVKRTRSGVNVLDMNGVRVGRDSDSLGSGDLKVTMKDNHYKWEQSFLGAKNCTSGSHGHGHGVSTKTPTPTATNKVGKSTSKQPAPAVTKTKTLAPAAKSTKKF